MAAPIEDLALVQVPLEASVSVSKLQLQRQLLLRCVPETIAADNSLWLTNWQFCMHIAARLLCFHLSAFSSLAEQSSMTIQKGRHCNAFGRTIGWQPYIRGRQQVSHACLHCLEFARSESACRLISGSLPFLLDHCTALHVTAQRQTDAPMSSIKRITNCC